MLAIVKIARVLAVAGVAVGLACASAPEVTTIVNLTEWQLNRYDCAAVSPSQTWLDEIAAIPERVEAAPESIEDVRILLVVGDDYRLTAWMFWRAENAFGGMSKREIHNGGPLHVEGDCSFALKDGRGWKAS